MRGGRLPIGLGEAGGHPTGAGFRFRDVATAGPGDGIGEREGADPAVQGSHLTAGAYSDRERSVTTGRSREQRPKEEKGGLGFTCNGKGCE